jgi:hypothetical protein
MEAQGDRRNSSYSFSTSGLDVVELSASSHGCSLPPGKGPPVPIVQETVWGPEPVWTQRPEEKSSCLCRGSNIDRPFLHSVVSHYTDWANRLIRNLYSSPNIIRQVKEDEVGWPCGTHGKGEKHVQDFGGKSEGKRPLRRLRLRGEYGNRINIWKIDWGGVEWIQLA